MPQPILYVAVTDHGFGHATRTASVVAEIKRLNPEILVILTTTAPRWLLESYVDEDFIHRPRAFDVGVLQQDSLTMDKAATLEKLQHIQSHQSAIVASEATFLKQNQVGLVLADIPPLATAIAHQAGVPCWMMSNFGWDFIYRAWGGEFEDIADWISGHFQQCDRLFRLPFSEPMSAFPTVEEMGLTGGTPRYEEAELRQRFNLTTPQERTVMLTFGGLGLAQIPYHNLTRFPDWQFISFDRKAPELSNLFIVQDSHCRPVDFMPLCSKVVSKPGYGTFAEACRLGIPIFSLPREDFAEAAVLLEGLQNYADHRILNPEDFFTGNWDFLEQPPLPAKLGRSLPTNGNQAIAQSVVEFLG